MLPIIPSVSIAPAAPMLTILAAAVLHIATVSFDRPPDRLERLVPALGAAVGKELRVEASLQNEVMVIHSKGVEPDDLLRRVADVAGAEWRTEEGYRLLVRPQALRSRLTEESAAERADRIRLSLLRNAPKGDLTDEEIRLQVEKVRQHNTNVSSWSSQERQASFRALLNLPERMLRLPRLAASLPWEQLGTTGRTVFSDRPNRMQTPFPKSSKEEVASVYRAFQLMGETAARYPSESKTGYHIAMSDIFGRQRSEAVYKVDLAATRMPNYILLVLEFLDAKGNILYTGTLRADPSSETPKAIEQVEAFGRPFRLSGNAGRMVKAYRQPPSSLPNDLRDRILDPVEFEPLGDSMLQSLQCLGEDANLDVVALVPDYPTPHAAAQAFELPSSYSGFLAKLNEVAPMKWVVQNGWVLGYPQDRELVRQERLDRKRLRDYLRAVAATGTLPFETLATFAYAFPTVNDTLAPLLVQRLQGLFRLGNQNQVMDWQTLRLWGALSPDSRRRLLAGQSLLLTSLSPSAKELLQQLAFRSEWGVDHARMGGDQAEPTESLPDGFAKDAVLMAKVEAQTMLKSTDPVGGKETGLRTAIEAIRIDAQGESAARYQEATLSSLELMVRADEGKWFGGTVRNHLWIDQGLVPKPLLEMPHQFLKGIVSSMEEHDWNQIDATYASKLRRAASGL